MRRFWMGMVLLIPACTAPTIDHAAEVEALREAAARYHAAASGKDSETVVSMYSEDALMIPPNAELVEGLSAVEGYRFGFIETPGISLDFELIRAEVSESGDMGWTFAIGQITIDNPDGPPGSDIVRDFHTWTKREDGSWAVVIDMWNSGLPAGD